MKRFLPAAITLVVMLQQAVAFDAFQPVAPTATGTRIDRKSGVPNIVLIFANYRENHLSEAPAWKRLLEQGAYCSSYYAPASEGAPSRAAAMTGKLPYRLGIYSDLTRMHPFIHLHASETTIPKLLRRAGYQNANFGQWHLSLLGAEKSESLPSMRDYGFDEWLTSDDRTSWVDKTKWWKNGKETGPRRGLSAEVIADATVNWIKEQDSESPFFAMVSFYDLEGKTRPPEEPEVPVGDATELIKSGFETRSKHLDKQTEKILTQLEESGFAKNTIVILTYDHGPEPEMVSPNSNFRGSEYQLWEGSVRVPTIIRWPGKVEPGSTISEPIGSIDWLQTFASITKSDESLPKDEPLDGADFSPLLTGEGEFKREKPLQWHHYKATNSVTGADSPTSAMRVGMHVITGRYSTPKIFSKVGWHYDVPVNDRTNDPYYLSKQDLSKGTFSLFDIESDPKQEDDLFDPENPEHLKLRDQLVVNHAELKKEAPSWGLDLRDPRYRSFSTWRKSQWGRNEVGINEISGRNADPDGDGYSNFTEFALATNPHMKDAELKVDYLPMAPGQAFLTCSFSVPRPEKPLKYFIDVSTDPNSWPEQDNAVEVTSRIRNTDGTFSVRARLVERIRDLDTKRYVRLRAEEPK